jgi:hypothetical protein
MNSFLLAEPFSGNLIKFNLNFKVSLTLNRYESKLTSANNFRCQMLKKLFSSFRECTQGQADGQTDGQEPFHCVFIQALHAKWA